MFFVEVEARNLRLSGYAQLSHLFRMTDRVQQLAHDCEITAPHKKNRDSINPPQC